MNSSNLSISTIALDLSGAIDTANKDIQNIFAFVGNIMQAVESFGSSISGAAKKSAVMAQAKQFADALGQVWTDVKAAVSSFIDSVKSAWNTVSSAVKSTL